MSIQILVVEPERRPELKEIGNSYDEMKGVVGGPIHSCYPFDDSVMLVRNGEGKVTPLPANRGLKDEEGRLYDIVCGTFLLCGPPAYNEPFTSLTPEQIRRYEERFHTPEMFWGMDGRIVCLPLEID